MALVNWMLVIGLVDIAFAVFSCNNDNRLIHVGVINYNLAANITLMHNSYRLKIALGEVKGQPRGANLNRVYYDKQLALIAREAVLECNLTEINGTDPRWYHVGQNMYLEYTNVPSHKQDWAAAIAAWFDEHAHYTFPGKNTKYNSFSSFSRATAHYTQLVWAETHNVGCEFAIFYEDTREGTPYGKLYTCFYGPGGNVAGKPPYLIGTPTECNQLC